MTTPQENDDFERAATPEEVAQLERERAERLDPANRPANAEVDNTTRDWVPESEDFRDNLEGHPPEWDNPPQAGGAPSDGAGTTRDPEIWRKIEESTSKRIDS